MGNVPTVVPAECMEYSRPLDFMRRCTAATSEETLAVGVPIWLLSAYYLEDIRCDIDLMVWVRCITYWNETEVRNTCWRGGELGVVHGGQLWKRLGGINRIVEILRFEGLNADKYEVR